MKEIVFWPESLTCHNLVKSDRQQQQHPGSSSHQRVWLIGCKLWDEEIQTQRAIVIGGLSLLLSQETETDEASERKRLESILTVLKEGAAAVHQNQQETEQEGKEQSIHIQRIASCWQHLQVLIEYKFPRERTTSLSDVASVITKNYPWTEHKKGSPGKNIYNHRQIVFYQDSMLSKQKDVSCYSLVDSVKEWLFFLDYAPLVRLVILTRKERLPISWINQELWKNEKQQQQILLDTFQSARYHKQDTFNKLDESKVSSPIQSVVSFRTSNPIMDHLLCTITAPIPSIRNIGNHQESKPNLLATEDQQTDEFIRDFLLTTTKHNLLHLQNRHFRTTRQARLEFLGGLLISISILWSWIQFPSTTPPVVILEVVDRAMMHQLHFVRSALQWLANNPLGIKVNAPLAQFLSQTMGNIVLDRVELIWSHVHSIFQSLIEHTFVSAVFVLVPTCLGFSGSLGCFYLLARTATWHLTLLSRTMQWILHSLTLRVLQTTWRLFRGRKHNILRQRTDTQSYDATQLLCGSIVFGIVLFLLSTLITYTVTLTLLQWALVNWWDMLAVALWKANTVDGTVSTGGHCLVLENVKVEGGEEDDGPDSEIDSPKVDFGFMRTCPKN